MIMYIVIGLIAVYAIVVEFIGRATSGPDLAPEPGAVRYIFYAVAISTIFLSQVVKVMMTRNPSNAEDAIARLTRANVVVAALAEVPVLLGLVMFILWRQSMDFYILALVSVYVTLRHFPRYASWEKEVRAAERLQGS